MCRCSSACSASHSSHSTAARLQNPTALQQPPHHPAAFWPLFWSTAWPCSVQQPQMLRTTAAPAAPAGPQRSTQRAATPSQPSHLCRGLLHSCSASRPPGQMQHGTPRTACRHPKCSCGAATAAPPSRLHAHWALLHACWSPVQLRCSYSSSQPSTCAEGCSSSSLSTSTSWPLAPHCGSGASRTHTSGHPPAHPSSCRSRWHRSANSPALRQ